MTDTSFILFDEVGGGGEAIVERLGRGVIFKKFIDEVFDDGFEQVGNTFIMIIESIAVNTDGRGETFDGDLIKGLLADKLQELLFNDGFGERGF